MILLDVFGVDLVYNDIPVFDAIVSLITIIVILITYILRRIFPFNVIWGFLVLVFVYASINYLGKKIKEWFN